MKQYGESSSGGRKRLGVGLGIALLAAALVVVPAAGAQAASRYPVYPTGAKSVTVQYGGAWSFAFHMDSTYSPCDNCASWFAVKQTGSSVPFVTHSYDYGGDRSMEFNNFTSNKAALPVGTYEFSVVHHRNSSTYGVSNASVTLTVVPTKLTTAVDIQPDPNHTAHAILSASATGALIDTAVDYGYGLAGNVLPPGVALMPSGTWQFTVNDSSGAKVYTKSVTTTAGKPPFASTYWTDVPAGKTFSATAIFVPDGSIAKSITVTAADPLSYTSAPPPASEVVPTTAPVTPVETKAAGYEVPAWAAGIWGILILGLIIALIVLVVRLARRPAIAPVATPEGQDDVS